MAQSAPKENKGSVFASMKQAAAPYLEKHGHAVLYGLIGFIAAALILAVGFWPTILLALFAAAGVAIGQYRDGDQRARKALRSLLERMK